MDLSSIICALIGGGITLVGVLIQNGKAMAVIQEKISNLAKQVEKHNSVVERTYGLEGKVALLEQDSKTTWHAIDEIKESIKIGGTE